LPQLATDKGRIRIACLVQNHNEHGPAGPRQLLGEPVPGCAAQVVPALATRTACPPQDASLSRRGSSSFVRNGTRSRPDHEASPLPECAVRPYCTNCTNAIDSRCSAQRKRKAGLGGRTGCSWGDMLLPQKIGKAIGICGIILRDVLVDDPGQDRDAALMKCSESSTVPRLAAPMSPRR